MTANVFVYGTLKEGFGNHRLLEGCRLVSRFAELQGPFRMVSLHAFPGVIRDKKVGGTIYGEVYEVDEETLQGLDTLEGHPHFYERREYIIVYSDRGRSRDVAYVYILPYEQYKDHTPVDNNKWKETDDEYQARFEIEVGEAREEQKSAGQPTAYTLSSLWADEFSPQTAIHGGVANLARQRPFDIGIPEIQEDGNEPQEDHDGLGNAEEPF